MNSEVKALVRERVEERTQYEGDVIDDYMEYHPSLDGFEDFGQFFGSIVYVMTPIGDEFYFKVNERDGEYQIREIAND
jgi:hypothetical protein